MAEQATVYNLSTHSIPKPLQNTNLAILDFFQPEEKQLWLYFTKEQIVGIESICAVATEKVRSIYRWNSNIWNTSHYKQDF